MVGAAAALALVACAAQAAAAGPRITLQAGVFEVRPAATSATLEVYVDGAGEIPPLLGVVSREGDTLRFTPRFTPQPGMRYRAVYRGGEGASHVQLFEIAAAAPHAATSLLRIDPSAELVPENLLKLYLNFSAPMARGAAYRHIRLLDERGHDVELPFLEIDQELWDRDGKRLTLLFDPGRVKRDLLPNEEVGTPLRAGAAYTLVIDREWRDAEGRPVASEARKAFRVGVADHDPPRVADWQLRPPQAGTLDPLLVVFPEPLDRALLERVLEVFDGSGSRVEGSVSVASHETQWRFTPRSPWKAGEYRLRAATILEDLAGNSLGRPFEVDVFEKVEDRALEVSESLRFRIR